MLSPTAKDTIFREGTAQLYRFRPEGGKAKEGLPLLLIPSLINRWYVLDLREKASFAGAMVRAGIDTYCLDWGIPEDEDRYLTWEHVLARLGRAVRMVQKHTGAPKVGILGYCMGGTLSTIWTAQNPDKVAALINLAGPIDFSQAGLLGHMVQPAWFDVGAIAAAGNVSPSQMQSGFVAMRPTLQMAKWVGLAARAGDKDAREAFDAMEEWSNDNVPFPAAAYETYIRELYQGNKLVAGTHYAAGKRVDLKNITCPVLTIIAERDTICPPAAATALNENCGSSDKSVIAVPGGHVGAVIGSKASSVMYPKTAAWLREKLAAPSRGMVAQAAV
ncbi:MAG: alpha/beta fold hydrolase [Polyangiaceae bacterium]|nr:alpha/beta fold hydrolase [Polyangiaceae bacterium]